MLLILALPGLAAAQTPGCATKGNLVACVYKEGAGPSPVNLGPGPASDLTWVSATEIQHLSTHFIFSMNCPAAVSPVPATETRVVPAWPSMPTTVVFPRDRALACTVSVEGAVMGERQVFDTGK